MLPRLFKTDADIRKHQINTLKIFNENVTEITEGEEYDICFNANGINLILKVILGQDFPKEKPSIKVIPAISHPWVNSEGEVVSAPGLLNFTVHSDLGRVVQVIVREFQHIKSPIATASNNMPTQSIPINGEIRSSPISYQTFSRAVKNFSPPLHALQSGSAQQRVAFPELLELSQENLQFLNENVDRQDEFIEELPIIKEQNKTMDELITNIEELAESNLSRQGKIEELRNDINMRLEEVTKLAFENERLHAIYQNLSDKYAPRNIQEQLRMAGKAADQESENVAESFLSGEIDVEKFVSDFIKIKTLCQTRKTKEEKLSQQLDRLEKAGF